MFLRSTAFYFLTISLFLFFCVSVSAQTPKISPEKIVGIWQWVKSYPAGSKNKEFYSQNPSRTVKLLKQYSFHVRKPTSLSKHATGFSAIGVFQLENNNKIDVGTYTLLEDNFSVKFETPSNPNTRAHLWKVKIKRLTKNEAEVLSIEDNYIHVFKKVKSK